MKFWAVTIGFVMVMFGCKPSTKPSLPILGETTIDEKTGDSVQYQAPVFEFVNQSNQTVSNEDFEGKIHVVDFFFTSCPTICPKMTNQLQDVQKRFENDERVAIISFSIDPVHDTPERLSMYADLHGINSSKWSLLSGMDTDVFELARDYKVHAFDDSSPNQPNLIHDGTFVLVDGERRIRGYYNGLEEEEVNRLIKDIELLLIAI